MSTPSSQSLCTYSCCALSSIPSSTFLPHTGTPMVSWPSSSVQRTSPSSPWQGGVNTLCGVPMEMGLDPPSSVPIGRVWSPVLGTWQSIWEELSWESGYSVGGGCTVRCHPFCYHVNEIYETDSCKHVKVVF